MLLSSLQGNLMQLDGGAMFGNAPRALWSQWLAPDQRHLVELTCRSFLIEDGPRKILLETGIGAFFAPHLKERYGVVEEGHQLLLRLAKLGIAPEQITHVVLSHLHFDHAGGMLKPWQEGQEPELVFSQAQVLVSQEHWQRATHPHQRDRASFIPKLQELLQASGRLQLLAPQDPHPLGSAFSMRLSQGHTPGMMITRIQGQEKAIYFVGDLMPGLPWVNLPITMGYDRFPELLIEEKKELLDQACAEKAWLLFTHDTAAARAQVRPDDRGRHQPEAAQPDFIRVEL